MSVVSRFLYVVLSNEEFASLMFYTDGDFSNVTLEDLDLVVSYSRAVVLMNIISILNKVDAAPLPTGPTVVTRICKAMFSAAERKILEKHMGTRSLETVTLADILRLPGIGKKTGGLYARILKAVREEVEIAYMATISIEGEPDMVRLYPSIAAVEATLADIPCRTGRTAKITSVIQVENPNILR